MSHTPKIPGINIFDSLTMGGDVKMVGLPTADPQVEDKLWNDNGGIKVSAGTLAFNISTRDTEENIITTSPTNPEGEYTIAYGTDTQDLYVWNGTVWYKFTDDQLFSNTYSLSFDGTDDYIDLGTSSSLNPTSALTISAWVRADTHNSTAGTYDAIYNSSKDAGRATTGFVLCATENKWYCYYYSGTTWYGVASDSNLVTGQWYHLASTWDGSTAKLYVNGSVQTSTLSLSSISYSTATSAKIGSYYTGNYLDGLIDEVSLFDSALSASDITNIYNSGTPNDISSLSPIGWWRMGDNDSGTGTTITDQGSGGNNGTLINSPTFSTTIPS
jgi:hypothetical protein